MMEVKLDASTALLPKLSEVKATALLTPREEILVLVEQLAALTLLKPMVNVYESLMDYLMLREEGNISGDKIPFDPVASKILGRMRELSAFPIVGHFPEDEIPDDNARFKFNIPIRCCSRNFALKGEGNLDLLDKEVAGNRIAQERDLMSKVRAFAGMILDAAEYGQILMDIEGKANVRDLSAGLSFDFISTVEPEKYAVEEWIAQANQVDAVAQMAKEEALAQMVSPEAVNLTAPVSSSESDFPELDYDSDDEFIGGGDDVPHSEADLEEVIPSVPLLADGGDVNANVDPIPDSPCPEDEICDKIHRLMAKINEIDVNVTVAAGGMVSPTVEVPVEQEPSNKEVAVIVPIQPNYNPEPIPTTATSLPMILGDTDMEPKLPLVRYASDIVTRQELALARQPRQVCLDPSLNIPARNALYPAYFYRQIGVMGQVMVGNVAMFEAPFHAVALSLIFLGMMFLGAFFWKYSKTRFQ